MRKLLIADDEKNIRNGVKAIVERKYEGRYEIFLCQDGLEALSIVEKERIDIVITDIRMPHMDGIAFIKELRSLGGKTEIVILSGYDDFSYVLDALKCGATDYLLKPLKREELFECIDKIEAKLKAGDEMIRREKLINDYIEDFRVNDLNSILLNEGMSEEELHTIASRMRLTLLDREGGYLLALLMKNDSEDSKRDISIKQEMDLMLEQYLYGCREEIITFFDWEKNLVLLTRDEEVVNYLSVKFMKDSKFKYTIALSDRSYGIDGMHSAYKQACEAQKYRIFTYYYNSVLIRYSDIAGKDKNFHAEVDKIERLCNMIGTDRELDIEKTLLELVNENKVNVYDISYIEDTNNRIHQSIYDHVIKRFYSDQDTVLNRYEKLGSIYNFSNYRDYLYELRDYIAHVNAYIKTIKEIYGDKNKIEKAIEYMAANYSRDLDMAVISNQVSLNYSYFSQLFKEYTGESFVNYLKKLRVEKAKELLTETSLKVYEVGERVGYQDSKQFTKIFRHIVGISPGEYRDRI